ncbi:hypothetical protein [Methylocapsa acidiphila]|uniref:hypothetical protein n=1 Tax=Methylocapsa acidiphila TaxID=133552 RepID=UPI00041FF38E|nr:hypothetical protein [Methylocapsa acidiphila]
MTARHLALGFALAVACWRASSPALAEAPNFANVLSAVTLDFAGGGQQDRAVLVQNADDGADLYIYLVKDEADSERSWTLAELKKNLVFSGAMWGQLPSLDVNGKGSLLIKSENEGVGRDRWSQTLTVVYRNNAFLIGGIAYTARDTIDLKAGGACDLNLLSGKGTRNGKPIEGKLAPIKLADWSDEKLPKECQF